MAYTKLLEPETLSRTQETAAAAAPQFQPAREQSTERGFISMTALSEKAIPGIFTLTPHGIGVSSATPQQLDTLARDLNTFLGEPKLVSTIVRGVGENLGKYVANLAGFVPIDSKGVEEDHFLQFGKLYMPEVEGCRAKFRLSRKETRAADVKISLSGFGGGIGRTLWCEMGQADELLASPKDLVIPVKARVVTWRNNNGKVFFTYSVVSYGRWISAITAKNPYFGSTGYDHLSTTRKGALGFVYGGQGVGNQERSFDFGEKGVYKMRGVLRLPPSWEVQVEGTVEFMSTVSILYALTPTHDYLFVEGNESPIEHYWAWRESPRR